MGIPLTKSIQDRALDLPKDEISAHLDKNWKKVPLELDYDLFDAPGDDLYDALSKFEQKFNVGLSSAKRSRYFPWKNTPMLTRWSKVKREDTEKTRKPLIIKILTEPAETGKWLYDQQPQVVVVTRSVARRQNNIDGEHNA